MFSHLLHYFFPRYFYLINANACGNQQINVSQVDISTMLEEAVHYVKFMQVQIKVGPFLNSSK
jgi:hypothetical protein